MGAYPGRSGQPRLVVLQSAANDAKVSALVTLSGIAVTCCLRATYAPYCTVAIVETLLGSAPGVTPIGDPYGARAESMPTTRDLGLDVVRSLDLATTVLRRYWSV